MNKKELRNIYRQKRLLLGEAETDKMQDLIMIRFQELALPFLHYMHTYLPMDIQKEVDTYPVMEFLKFSNPGLNIVVPKTHVESNSMTHYIYDENTVLVKNAYHIMEPAGGQTINSADIDLVLVPLLAFDERGYRVGYGKGFYDRFLLQCRKDVIKIGLSFFQAEPLIDDTDEFDIPLTHCVTPQKVYEF
ncbi:5-formyltetrahydrofolate cyclo-ligase [Agriterribacter sp.]|uniref:5-formyltetrahydrofolate cyclo-ligase n=1 Tax=Agriterribacter sp. TaxID=2821509 RepID=UPI002C82FFD2|nr:5-formyltetrahydrofolate cyclo-ligase [Agriterribacter sp.]HTN06478.1 5-formyltetrahydrofolate cyclo-ligase [Agriterribacter sp.]